MTTEDFNNGDLILIELTEYDDIDKSKKPVAVVSNVIVSVGIDRRGKRFIEYGNHGKSLMKNFKKGNQVKGSFGMTMWKNSWLNIGYRVIGGLDVVRDYKLNKLLETV
jgi:hypothetical protein